MSIGTRWRRVRRLLHGHRIQYNEARTHAVLVALIGWTYILGVAGLGHGNKSALGSLQWADFVHFYTLGHIARTHSLSLLYNAGAQHALQTALVPESIADYFIPVYAPQTALLFAPLSLLPYFSAGLVWAVVTVAVYGWAVWLAWRPARATLRDPTFLLAAALAAPPLWRLAAYGQTTAVVIVAFAGGWWAHERGHRILAGGLLSLVAIKPQFGLVLTAVAVLTAEGRMLVGGLLGVGVQALAAAVAFGGSVFATYLAVVRNIPTLAPLLEPNPSTMHSVRALTRHLGGRGDWVAWAVASTLIIAVTTSAWRQTSERRLQFGLLVLASALVNPHLAIYDATVLALPVVWLGGYLLDRQADTRWYWYRVYLIAIALFIPTAALVKIQVSAILLAELFIQVARAAAGTPNARGHGAGKQADAPAAAVRTG